MKIYQTVNIGILNTFEILKKSLKVNHCFYFIFIFAHCQRILMTCIVLKEINMNFKIIALTESRINKNPVSPINTELEKYSPTERAAGGALLYINKRLSYHPRNDLNVYMPGKLESIFTEIVYLKSSNIIVGCIHKQPSLQMKNFTNDIILPLFRKLNKENSKKNFLLSNRTLDLLQYETSESVNNFVDTLSSNFPSPLILLPIQISNSSSTLIDNINCNRTFTSNIILGNLMSTVSDHLPQIAIIEDFYANSPKSKLMTSRSSKMLTGKHFYIYFSDNESKNYVYHHC